MQNTSPSHVPKNASRAGVQQKYALHLQHAINERNQKKKGFGSVGGWFITHYGSIG